MDKSTFLQLVIKPDGHINRMAARLLTKPSNEKWKEAQAF